MQPDFFSDELNALRVKGLDRRLTDRDPKVRNLSHNDYLGLAHHPDVIRAAQEATEKFGTGATSSRLLSGTVDAHRSLEKDLAAFFGKEAALAFSSGYHVNTGILPALTGPEDWIFFDRLSHASLIDGIRLSGAQYSPFHHNDTEDLAKKLKARGAKARRRWIVTEGVFSMDGDRPRLREIVQLARENEAYMYLDEAHSVGLFGRDGRGIAEEDGLLDQIDVFVGTLSKSLGTQGGFVAGSRSLVDLLTTRCRSFLFTTGLAPAAAAAGEAALRLLPKMEAQRRSVLNVSETIRKELVKAGFDTMTGNSQIIPVWTGSVETTVSLSRHLFDRGFFVPSIRPPTVPTGEGRVRLSITTEVDANVALELLGAFTSFGPPPRRQPGAELVEKD